MDPSRPPAVEVRTGPHGPVLYAAGRPLTGADPRASIPRRLPRNDDPLTDSQTLFLLFSPAQGHGIDAWFSRLPADAAVLVVELEPALARLTELRSWGTDRRLVTVWAEHTALRAAADLIRRYALRRTVAVHLSGGARLHRRTYESLQTRINAEIGRFWSNRGTEIQLHRRWMTNIFRNGRLSTRPADEVADFLTRRAIMVGAGPLLERALPFLKRRFAAGRDRNHDTTLVAIDTALPALADAGVRPDLIAAMDGQLANARDFLPWRWDGVPILADLTTHFSILRRAAPRDRFVFVSRFTDSTLFQDPDGLRLFAGAPIVPPRGSVAPTVLSLLTETHGVVDVLCVGVDFWYRLPQTHGRSTAPDRLVRRQADRLHHRDGHDRSLLRPWRTVTLRDGTSVVGDGILADQADHLGAAVSEEARVLQLGYAGVNVGLASLPVEHLDIWWDADHDGAGKRTDGATNRSTDGATATGRSPVPVRREAMQAILERLRVQERRLMDPSVPVLLDAGLEFTVADLPQWPRMSATPQWMELHRRRILRAVRDYRRRLEALLFRASP